MSSEKTWVEHTTNGADRIVLLHTPGRIPVCMARGSEALCDGVAEQLTAALASEHARGFRKAADYCEASAGVYPADDERWQHGWEALSAIAAFFRAVAGSIPRRLGHGACEAGAGGCGACDREAARWAERDGAPIGYADDPLPPSVPPPMPPHPGGA